ncbi:hypothetical protein [Pseudomonas sp. RIT-PI-r]|uniref:hypothetical protein n=1 Tax=Pseudomonas sp. RIT-PI-r TaxID=1699620 RepID=UPI000A8702ED|nr:hypothetical protein [Pseudomonas sp. RIT-PI-r]
MDSYVNPRTMLIKEKNKDFTDFDGFREALAYFISTETGRPFRAISVGKGGKFKMLPETLAKINQKELHLHHIHFPGGAKGEKIISSLECFRTIRFTQCIFSVKKIPLSFPRVSFFDCRFVSEYEVVEMKLRKEFSYDDCLYQKCTFEREVVCVGEDQKERKIISNPLFSGCIFSEGIKLKGLELNGYLFDGDTRYPTVVEKIIANDCVFHDATYLNDMDSMGLAEFVSCVFKGKFEFKNNVARELLVDNCNFEKMADFYGGNIFEMTLTKSIFSKFAGFENCIFGLLGSKDAFGQFVSTEKPTGKTVTLRFVTFLEFASFRGAKFKGGLDVEKINTMETPNFHNVELDFEGSNRETFRAIKHALDNHGGHIEANSFFALEMKKYKKEMVGRWPDRLVYSASKFFSNFGQCYICAVSWISVLSMVFYLLTIAQTHNCLYKIYPEYNPLISKISDFFNGWASGFLPFKQFLRPGMEFVSLVFSIAFGVLIWQVIVSMKRLIKR